MPDLTTAVTDPRKTASNFQFTGQKVAELAASEYTLVGLAIDTSSSVAGFKTELDATYGKIIKGCRKSPRAHNLLARCVEFGSDLEEKHGFVELSTINEGAMDFRPDGMTALYDATLDAIEAVATYGSDLAKRDRFANALVVIVTDGGENHSRRGNVAKIKAAIEKIRKDEELESVKVILVGLGDDKSPVKPILEAFKNDAGLDQFVWVGEATPGKLAKLAEFVSRSISAASQSLGTGGPSQNLNLV
jgi:uncharacterized protein YegL